MNIPRLHVITDETLQTRHSHADLARLAVAGGADAVQYREKRQTDTQTQIATVTAMLAACGESLLVVDDRADVALSAGAPGLHLGAKDLDVATARKIVGDTAIIGGTANSLAEAQQVWRSGVNYLGVGPVYGTQSKANPAPVMGLTQLKEICQACPLPVIAIGSITAARIPEVMETGAHGVAVISEVVLAEDPTSATAACMDAIQRCL